MTGPGRGAVRLGTAEDLGPAAVLAVADGADLEPAPALLEGLARSRDATLAALAAAGPVYGVTTGMGRQSHLPVAAEDRAGYQDDLMLARSAGTAPWLDRRTTRAVLATRLRTLLAPEVGVSPGLARALVGALRADALPALPATGSGAAGEIIPLAHLGAFLTGAGQGLADDGTTARPAADVLAAADLPPYPLGPKEGVALLQGVPVATACAVLLGDEVRLLTGQALAAAAAEVALVRAPRDPYAAPLARGDAELARVHASLLRLAGEEPEPRSLQAPVSFRVVGPALAHLLRMRAQLAGAVERALCGVTTSPALVDGRFLGTAGFDGFDLAAGADAVRVALVHAAELGTARLHRLLDPAVTGLTPQLSAEPGRHAGLVVLHKRAVGLVHELRRGSAPASLGAMETSLGQEDVQSHTLEAMAAVSRAAEVLRDVVACELVAVHQGVLLGRSAPLVGRDGLGHRMGPKLETVLHNAFEVLPDTVTDRPPGPEVAAVRAVLRLGWANHVLDRPLDSPSRPARPSS